MSLGKLQRLILGPSIPVISISGLIEIKTTEKLTRDLQKINKNTAEAVALVINSEGGSLTQSQIIGEKIKYFCKQNKLPFYTFAGDACLSSAYYLLSMGDKVYADESSLIGSFGLLTSHTSLKKFTENLKIENRSFATSDNLLGKILDNYEGIQESDQTYLQNIISQHNKNFQQYILSQRGDKLQSQDYEKLFSGNIYLGSEAQKEGLVDKIQDYQSSMYEQYPKASLDFISSRPGFSDYKQSLSTALQKIKVDVQIVNKQSVSSETMKSNF